MVNLCVLLPLLRFKFTTGCFCCSSLSFLRVQFSFRLTLFVAQLDPPTIYGKQNTFYSYLIDLIFASHSLWLCSHRIIPTHVLHHLSHRHCCCCCPPSSTFHLSGSPLTPWRLARIHTHSNFLFLVPGENEV